MRYRRSLVSFGLLAASVALGLFACSGNDIEPGAGGAEGGAPGRGAVPKGGSTPPGSTGGKGAPTTPGEGGIDAAPDAGGLDASAVDGTNATLGLLETTDLHTTVRSYDYYKLSEDKSIGLERTATLVKEARAELVNTLLVDNGDTVQGTVLADYQAIVSPIACRDTLAVYKVMNALGYDVAGVGNHEFNYGLDFLAQATHRAFPVAGVDGGVGCGGPTFPVILSNVLGTSSDETLFPPSVLVEKTITATLPDGRTARLPLRVGFMAFTPPAITSWDKRWLDGKVYTKGVREVAPALVESLRAQGADLVVAIIHGGIATDVDTSKVPPVVTPTPYAPELESQAYYLAQVPGIDAMLLGHSHQAFPNPTSTSPGFNVPGVDKAVGTIHGVPAVMANFWGQHLGVIKLSLTVKRGRWSVDRSRTIVEARPITTTCAGGVAAACSAGTWRTGGSCAFATACAGQPDKTKVYVDADPNIAGLVAAEHESTIAYVKTPIGTTDFAMSTYFADVGDVTAIQIVNQAQEAYVTDYVRANLPELASLPVLSVSAPFKSGFQGGNDYTDVPAGNLAINNAADLYLYANTLYAVKVTGQTLVDWLETAATRFAQIDPTKTEPQELVNPRQPGYNFDSFTSPDLSYEIDVTKPLPPAGQKAQGRVVNVKYKGAPLDLGSEFIVATNNYRASGGGSFPGLDGSKTIYASPDSNRDILIAYIRDRAWNLTRAANGSARSWRFAKTSTKGPVVLRSAQNKLPLARAAGLSNVSLLQQDDGSGKGLSLYAIDLENP